MGSNIIVNQVIILFIIMIVGFAAKKTGMLDRDVSRKLSEILLNITAPAIVITAFCVDFSKEKLFSGITVFAFSAGSFILSAILSIFLFKRSPENRRKILQYVTVYSNCGYMGIPVLGGLFGQDGVFYASIFLMVFNVFIWTNGVAIFTGQKGLKMIKKAFLNPGVISVFIGMVIFLFSIKLPGPLYTALSSIGSMTTPLSMMIIGGLLADVKFKELFSGLDVYIVSIIRLLILPLAFTIIMVIIGFPEKLVTPCATLVAMPAAVNTAIFSEKFGGDSAFASKCVAFTTLFCILTIPAIIFIAQNISKYIPTLL